MPKIILSSQAIEDMVYFSSGRSKLLAKIARLVESIQKTPFAWIGKPEPLKHDFQGFWSRRIDQEHRLIYRVSKDAIEILSFRGYYSD
jgi:toxin YoeB